MSRNQCKTPSLLQSSACFHIPVCVLRLEPRRPVAAKAEESLEHGLANLDAELLVANLQRVGHFFSKDRPGHWRAAWKLDTLHSLHSERNNRLYKHLLGSANI